MIFTKNQEYGTTLGITGAEGSYILQPMKGEEMKTNKRENDAIARMLNAAQQKVEEECKTVRQYDEEVYEAAGEPYTIDKVSDEEKEIEDRMHIDRLAEIVSSYTEEDAMVAMDILLKTHPRIVFNQIGKEYLRMMKKMEAINTLLGGE